jgi:hypothetical protein
LKYSRRKKEEGRRKKEEGRRKKEEGRKLMVSAINNVRTVLAVAITSRVKLELKMLYANRINYLNCFITCILVGI